MSYFVKHVRVPFDAYKKHKLYLDKYKLVYDKESQVVYILVNNNEDWVRVAAHMGFPANKDDLARVSEGFCVACIQH